MKIIVTGGKGWIGSHIVDLLIKSEHEVIVIDNESTQGHKQFYRNDKASYFPFDIRNKKEIAPLFKNVDYVFHLAAQSRIMATMNNPYAAAETNIMGSINVLECSLEAGVKKVMYSSTSAAYDGIQDKPPYREDMYEYCQNPYAVSKLAGEKFFTLYEDLYGLKSVIFRYFNVYGQRAPLLGSSVPVIHRFIEQRKKNEPITIVGDGSMTRDFIHVYDIAEANLLAMESNVSHEIINIGFGKDYSLKQVAKMISDDIIYIEPVRKFEAGRIFADISKAKKLLEWVPKIDVKDYIKLELSRI